MSIQDALDLALGDAAMSAQTAASLVTEYDVMTEAQFWLDQRTSYELRNDSVRGQLRMEMAVMVAAGLRVWARRFVAHELAQKGRK
jgi:hypothetical protein